MWHWGWGLGHGVFPFFLVGGFRLVVLAGIVVGIVYLVRAISRRGGMGREDSAVEILEKRYARGEITKEQLDEMKRNLG